MIILLNMSYFRKYHISTWKKKSKYPKISMPVR